MRLFLALRVFFIVLFRRDSALQISYLLTEKPSPPKTIESPKQSGTIETSPISTSTTSSSSTQTKSARRSEALTLLSALQRESRLLDLVWESLDQYSDAQIGGAARDVLRDTRRTLDRIFGLEHLLDSPEGQSISVPKDASPVRWRIVGTESCSEGTLIHPGWQAKKLDLPQWSGSTEDSTVIAAAEVETYAT